MTMKTHDTITTQLSDYLDGELTPMEHAAVDNHLAQCPECREVLEDLRALVAAAKRLPGALPERELWEGIEGRIDAPRSPLLPFGAAASRRFAFTLPQLAAAGIALMVLSGGLVYLARPGEAPATTAGVESRVDAARMTVSPVSAADPQYEDAIGDLERTLAAGRSRLDPETVRVLEQNLETIDRAIAQSRQALEADPGNVFLNSHLLSARQRKLTLLRRATALTTGS